MSHLQTSHKNTQQKLDAAWETFVTGNLEASFKILTRMAGYSYSRLSPGTRELAECLLSYDYPALQQVTEITKREFTLAVARKWLFSRFPITRGWDKADEPLATILGTSYVLDIDVEAMDREINGELGGYTDDKILPVSYEQRTNLFPQLISLPILSLAARKIFVRAMQGIQVRSGFVEYSRLIDSLPGTPEFDEGLTELAEAGLIDLDPSATDLLMNLTLKDLKQFAFRHEVRSHGPKHRLIQAIVAQAGQEEVKSLLNSLGTEVRYIRPLVTNLSLLKKYVWAEVHRLELYLEWIQRVHCLCLAPLQYHVQPPPAHRHMEPWMGLNDNPRRGWTKIEKLLVRDV
jgi:hypothetical protein